MLMTGTKEEEVALSNLVRIRDHPMTLTPSSQLLLSSSATADQLVCTWAFALEEVLEVFSWGTCKVPVHS